MNLPLASIEGFTVSYNLAALYNSHSALMYAHGATLPTFNVLGGYGWKWMDYPKLVALNNRSESPNLYFLENVSTSISHEYDHSSSSASYAMPIRFLSSISNPSPASTPTAVLQTRRDLIYAASDGMSRLVQGRHKKFSASGLDDVSQVVRYQHL